MGILKYLPGSLMGIALITGSAYLNADYNHKHLEFKGNIGNQYVEFTEDFYDLNNVLILRNKDGLERRFVDNKDDDLIVEYVEYKYPDGSEETYRLGSYQKVRRFGYENPNEAKDEALQSEFENILQKIERRNS